MRILVAEDDKAIASALLAGLSEQGYAVDIVEDGEQAIDFAELTRYDQIILDVMLPVRQGTDVCRTLRKRGLTTPILMLTARDTVEDRVEGLDSGADDYLVKPFAFSELLARLRALARRPSQLTGRKLRLGDLELDSVTRLVTRGGRQIQLTSKEYALLEYFLRHANQVLTRSQIVENVWNYDYSHATNVIDVHIRNLRRKLDDPSGTSLIQTVRGAGYQMSES